MSRGLGLAKSHFREGLKRPWEARWYENGKQKSKFFDSEELRDKYITAHNRKKKQFGSRYSAEMLARVDRLLEASRLVPEADPMDVYRFYRDRYLVQKFGTDLRELVAEYLAAKKATVSEGHFKTISFFLGQMVDGIGVEKAELIDLKHAQRYVDALQTRLALESVWNHRKDIRAFFNWCVRLDRLEANPFANVQLPEVVRDEPGILSLEDAREWFAWVVEVDPVMAALMGATAFGGLRQSAVLRLKPEDLDPDGILQPARKTKIKRRHYITGLPGNVFPWLDLLTDEAYELTPNAFKLRRSRLITRYRKHVSDRHWSIPKNAMRHSFASHHLAAFENPALTAKLISHRGDMDTLWDHYAGSRDNRGQLITKERGLAWFEIVPPPSEDDQQDADLDDITVPFPAADRKAASK
ncbi:MAG: hypothetical protein ABQ298_03845 [Puniceicoccaceae bacterium]